MATQRVKQPKPTRQRTRTVSPIAPTPAPTASQFGAVGAVDGDDGVERIALTPDTRLLLTPTEAAKRLSISRALCYRWLAAGIIPSILLGERLRRVPVAALEAYIAAQMTAQGVTSGVTRGVTR